MSQGRFVIRGGRVVDPRHGVDRVAHLLCEDGRVVGLTSELSTEWLAARHLDAEGRLVAPGLVDLRTHVGEPGEEWKEDLASAARAAVAGGFTTVCATPDTTPCHDTRAVTELVTTRAARAHGARVLPVGAATVGLEGVQLTEMGDLADAGCVAVSTGELPLPSAKMTRRVLEYARSVGLPLLTVAMDPSLGKDAMMHEGQVSLRLGMRAVPGVAEAIGLFRDGSIATLVGHRVHFHRVASREALPVLARFKDAGVPVTADVTPHHLWFTEDVIASFDTNARLQPPLRAEADVRALRDALDQGLIDAVATDHRPQSSVEKLREFESAGPGTVGLETALPVLLELVRQGALSLPRALAALSDGPARVLGQSEMGHLAAGARADVVVVDVDSPYLVDPTRLVSRSRNCLFSGQSLTGAVVATVVGGRVFVEGEEVVHVV